MYLNGYTAQSTIGSYVAFTGIILFLASFSVGMSSTPWTINTEIYPLHVIGTANSLSTTTNWATNFVVATVFLLFLDTKLGSVLSFIVLAAFAMFAWIFVYYLLPETAGRNIDEILFLILGTTVKDSKCKMKEMTHDGDDTVYAGEIID
jgi:SP family myo-inositol transporter-like MFS transporter 13